MLPAERRPGARSDGWAGRRSRVGTRIGGGEKVSSRNRAASAAFPPLNRRTPGPALGAQSSEISITATAPEPATATAPSRPASASQDRHGGSGDPQAAVASQFSSPNSIVPCSVSVAASKQRRPNPATTATTWVPDAATCVTTPASARDDSGVSARAPTHSLPPPSRQAQTPSPNAARLRRPRDDAWRPVTYRGVCPRRSPRCVSPAQRSRTPPLTKKHAAPASASASAPFGTTRHGPSPTATSRGASPKTRTRPSTVPTATSPDASTATAKGRRTGSLEKSSAGASPTYQA